MWTAVPCQGMSRNETLNELDLKGWRVGMQAFDAAGNR